MNKGAKYDEMIKRKSGDELGLFQKYEETFERFREKIIEENIKSIIDFGCGTGNLCGELSEDIKVLGVDRNLEMLEEGKRKYPKMNFIEGSILDVSNINEKADISVSSFVLHGLEEEDKKKVILNMLSLSNEKRIILIDFMFENKEKRKECKEELIKRNRSDLWEFIDSKNYFIVEDLKAYVEKLNLKVSFKHIVNFTWVAEIYN